ncbi:rhamnogalacturonan acetylesterase [Winogradskyella thalassocola]|uniref:Lysophospholipase L1 n=1 Tax=Winogradskyella thalassocola TaxID=262004 RepID=A0A1G7Y7S6_9FLAO|nr:rhamnogalacturonan acetylesterase [Winogradskyella thalassocola]SDG92469.1 Lysophospholipase L1 [Winogradskyella thalassocola]
MKHYKVLFFLILIIYQSCKKDKTESQSDQRIQNISIYTIGDSTMADKPNPEENPERGWCQLLPQFLNNNATVKNHAVNGRSTRSFIAEGRWDSVYQQMKKGDYIFIQFGHNDQKINNPNRYTNPHTAYRNNLIKFVSETREMGATPVLFTSIVRRNFNEEKTLVDTHGEYPQEVRSVAQEFNVPLIDLQYLTEKLEEAYGVNGSKKLHLHYAPNEIPYYPEGKEDNTHLSVLGATEVARLAVNALNEKVEGFDAFTKTN